MAVDIWAQSTFLELRSESSKNWDFFANQNSYPTEAVTIVGDIENHDIV